LYIDVELQSCIMLSNMPFKFSPPFIASGQTTQVLKTLGYAVLNPSQSLALLAGSEVEFADWLPSWNDLPPDAFLKDGGRYRRRRHSCFIVAGAQVTQTAHRAHWQPIEYNALHGGMQRLFEPMSSKVSQSGAWTTLLSKFGKLCSELKPNVHTWFVEAHQFRIDTTDGIGRPTPEGAHRDGVDFVAVMLINRHGIKGGETRVFDVDGPAGQRFTMTEPWTLLLLDDERVIHESTPIQPIDAAGSGSSYRDTLVLTFRAKTFQGDGA
jgi:hypothetical protein